MLGIGSFFDFFDKILGNTIGNSANKIADVVDRFVETSEEKKAAEILKTKLLQQPSRWQTEINKIEVRHRSIFVAGWRPAIGWICALALGWGWVLAPIIETLLVVVGKKVNLPTINVAEALGLATIMLGNATLRTIEKNKGTTL